MITTIMDAKRVLRDASLVAATLALPLLTFYLTIAVRDYEGELVLPNRAFLARIVPPDAAAIAMYAGWMAFQAALFAWLPGANREGSHARRRTPRRPTLSMVPQRSY